MLQKLENELHKMASATDDSPSSPHSMLRLLYKMFKGTPFDADSDVAYAICGGMPIDDEVIYRPPAITERDNAVVPRKLDLSDFRCFKSLHVEFGEVDEPIYYLAGRMGVGKTTVVNAIKLALTGGVVTKHRTHGTKTKPEVVLSTADGGRYTIDRPLGNGLLRSAFLQPTTARLRKPAAEIAASIMQSARCDELSKFLAFVKYIKAKLPKIKEVDTTKADAIVDNIRNLWTDALSKAGAARTANAVELGEWSAAGSDADEYARIADLIEKIYDAYINMWHVDEGSEEASQTVGAIVPPDLTESENLVIAALVSQAAKTDGMGWAEKKTRDHITEAALSFIKKLRDNAVMYVRYASPDSLNGMYAICDSVRDYNIIHNTCAVCDTAFPTPEARDAASQTFTDRINSCVYSDATEVMRTRMKINDSYDQLMYALREVQKCVGDIYKERTVLLNNSLRVMDEALGKAAGLESAHDAAVTLRDASDVDSIKVSLSLLVDTLITTLIPAVMESLVFKDLEAVCNVVNTFYNNTIHSGLTLALYPMVTGTNKIDIKVKANGTPIVFEELSHGQQNVLCTLFDAAYLAIVDRDTRIVVLDDTLTAVDMGTASKVIKYIQHTLKFKLVLVPTQLTDMFLFNYGYVSATGTNQVIQIKRENV